MLVVERGMDYGCLAEALAGKKVLIWACNDCARLCNGVGGTESAERLAAKLSQDGIEIVGVRTVSASCIGKKVDLRINEDVPDYDIVVSLSCAAGAKCVSESTSKEVLNPVRTLGIGYLDKDRIPRLLDGTGPGPDMTPFC